MSLSTALFAATFAGAAFAGNPGADRMSDSAAHQTMVHADVDDAYAMATARVDQRLNMLMSGPTTMDCSMSADAAYETCVVTAAGTPSAVPASLARN